METLKAIVNKKKVCDAFFNLFDRWRDEEKYEDLNDYGNAIVNVMREEFPHLDITLKQTTSDPFGVTVSTNKGLYKLWTSIKGSYVVLNGKRLVNGC